MTDLKVLDAEHSTAFRTLESAEKFACMLRQKNVPGVRIDDSESGGQYGVFRVWYRGQPMLPEDRYTPPASSRHWARPEYQARYGHWFAPREPDFTRCAAEVVSDRRGASPHQCGKHAHYDEDHTGKPTRCLAHSRAKQAEKRAKEEARMEADKRAFRLRGVKAKAGPEAWTLIRKIAEGHNDPRGAAREFMESYPELFGTGEG